MDVEIWAAASLAKAFDKLGIKYARTQTGQPSFTKVFCLSTRMILQSWLSKHVTSTRYKARLSRRL